MVSELAWRPWADGPTENGLFYWLKPMFPRHGRLSKFSAGGQTKHNFIFILIGSFNTNSLRQGCSRWRFIFLQRTKLIFKVWLFPASYSNPILCKNVLFYRVANSYAFLWLICRKTCKMYNLTVWFLGKKHEGSPLKLTH